LDHQTDDAGRIVERVLTPAELAAELAARPRAFPFAGDADAVAAAIAGVGRTGDLTPHQVRGCGPYGRIVRCVAQAAERPDPAEAVAILRHAWAHLAVLYAAVDAAEHVLRDAVGKLPDACRQALEKVD
jgi:hypothetical protein